MNLKDAPIKKKLTLAIMLTSTVVLCLTATIFFIYEIITFRQTLVQNAQTIAQITAAESSAAVDFEDEKVGTEIISKLNAEPTIQLAALYTGDGKILAHYPASAPLNYFPGSPEIKDYTLSQETLNMFVPVQQAGHVIGTLYLKWDLSGAYRRFRWYGAMMIVVSIGLLVIAFAISNWLQRGISGPILELAETARAISTKRDYKVRAQKYGGDELGLLTDAFNHMLTQIQERDEALRKNEEQLRSALQAAHASANEVRSLNTELEERVARRTTELATINRELEAFTYSVSHDLRAPLRHIDAYAQILQDDLARDPSSAVGHIARIRQGVQSMGRLIDDLLNLSRVSRAEVLHEKVQLNQIVDEVLVELKPELAGRNIEWRIGKLPSAEVDPGLIKQVFTNLVSNAVKYTRPRSPAVIEIGREEVDGQPAIFVRDNGVGFNMKYAAKLFGVFQRLHRPDEFEGTGVGLATVQRIVHLHGGRIWVDAELDKGATFHFTLKGMEKKAGI
jgi:signal transduction histidine kinase